MYISENWLNWLRGSKTTPEEDELIQKIQSYDTTGQIREKIKPQQLAQLSTQQLAGLWLKYAYGKGDRPPEPQKANTVWQVLGSRPDAQYAIASIQHKDPLWMSKKQQQQQIQFLPTKISN